MMTVSILLVLATRIKKTETTKSLTTITFAVCKSRPFRALAACVEEAVFVVNGKYDDEDGKDAQDEDEACNSGLEMHGS